MPKVDLHTHILTKPTVTRMSPVPLYSSFHDVWRAAAALAEALDA